MNDKRDDLLAAPPSGGSAAPVRDPRVNPRAGDVLRKGCSTVTVDGVGTGNLRYRFEGYLSDVPPMARWDEPWLPGWREWAKDAEVINVASIRTAHAPDGAGASNASESSEGKADAR